MRNTPAEPPWLPGSGIRPRSAADLVLNAVWVATTATDGSPAAVAARDQAHAAVEELPPGSVRDLLGLVCGLLEMLARSDDLATVAYATDGVRAALADLQAFVGQEHHGLRTARRPAGQPSDTTWASGPGK